MTTEILIGDVNEFHPLIDGGLYAAWSPVLIIRVCDGTSHVDTTFAKAVKLARGKVHSIGFYAFVRINLDIQAQARYFATLILQNGGLGPLDFISFDIEVDPTGQVDLSSYAELWLGTVHAILHEQVAQDWGYSGESFWKAHLSNVKNVHKWIAAYGQGDPNMGEDLWQKTDNQTMPGVQGPADCSRFLGTYAQFQALINPNPSGNNPSGVLRMLIKINPADGQSQFQVKPDGSVECFGPLAGQMYKGGVNKGAPHAPASFSFPITDFDVTPTGDGYVLIDVAGETYAFGDAVWEHNTV